MRGAPGRVLWGQRLVSPPAGHGHPPPRVCPGTWGWWCQGPSPLCLLQQVRVTQPVPGERQTGTAAPSEASGVGATRQPCARARRGFLPGGSCRGPPRGCGEPRPAPEDPPQLPPCCPAGALLGAPPPAHLWGGRMTGFCPTLWVGPTPQLMLALTQAAPGLSWCPASLGAPVGSGDSAQEGRWPPVLQNPPAGCRGSCRAGTLTPGASAWLGKIPVG